MITVTAEDSVRNLCGYLGFDAELPMGRMATGGFGWSHTRHVAEIETDGQDGTLVRELVEALHPLRKAQGEHLNDGRTGRQAAIESLLLSWPSVPQCDADWCDALGGREWLEQGKDWECVDVRGRAVFEALASGESPASIRARIRSADPALVADHRAARHGSKVRPLS